MAYDAARQQIILFGGSDLLGNSVGDTWAWNGETWSQLSPAATPGTRILPAMAYDPSSERIVMFGGSVRTCTGTCIDTFSNETWTFDGTTWARVPTASAPPPSNFGALAFDPSSDALVLAGGQGRTNPDIPLVASLRSAYTFDGQAWTEHPSTVPEERKDPSLVYDPVSGLVLMIGGTCIYDATCGVWAWDGQAWSFLSDGPKGWYAPAAYHPNTKKVVFLGAGGTWLWDGACRTWSKATPETSPPPRYGWAAATDPGGNVVLFGGSTGTAYLADTWVWDGTTWIKASGTQPPSRAFAAAAYDSARGETVMFGGLTAGGNTYYDDTWVWNGTNWTQRTLATRPPTRAWHALAADPQSGSLMMVGGIGGPNLTVHSDLWFWDGAAWSQAAGQARFGAGLAEHPPSASVVLFGGQDSNPGRMMSDTRLWHAAGGESQDPSQPSCS
jgi:hypothetical protein